MRVIYLLCLLISWHPGSLVAQITDIYKLPDPGKMDSVYKSYSPALLRDCVSISKLDDIRSYIAASYAYYHNQAKVEEYVSQLQYGPEKGNQYFRIARSFENANDLAQTERFAKLAADSVMGYLELNPAGVSPASILASSLVLLTEVLEKQRKYEEAIRWLTDRTEYCSARNRAGLLSLKADMLVKAAKYNEALDTYTAVLKARAGGKVVEQKMKQAYVAWHGADTLGFEAYLSDIKARIAHEFSDSISKSTLKSKAPLFELKDLDGKIVKLADYLGKVVVLDFWATWCVPCKASFPAMQKAINKYSADTSVVFLFIDTWEYNDSMEKEIKEFLSKKQYTFRVLRDRKDEVVKQYGVDGVPAKFVIDREGYIRFSMKGFNGTDEESVAELAEMITLSR
ncbi:Peroxiredoxin [Chitinophaga sancti]|uniref:Peroxiredoxin n=2 Tax=Chitinophaga sancti TaxID=1004 RepID=A0A1K1SJN8_9BACT|nr:Peroxiredoxin [Chitinophaga sancti]